MLYITGRLFFTAAPSRYVSGLWLAWNRNELEKRKNRDDCDCENGTLDAVCFGTPYIEYELDDQAQVPDNKC